jgi:tetratricopeptide (TPR) repeat protein
VSIPKKPKHPSQAAERPFVDREEFVAPVHSALKEPPRTKPLVLVYYGGAGIGKSRLRRELVKQMAADPGVLVATLDFHIPIYRQPEAALLFLRNSLREAYQADFPSFDLAYAIYWQKTHSDAPLGDDLKPLLVAGSLLSQVLDDSGQLPLIGLIPKMAKLLAASLDPLNARPLDSSLRAWWENRGERELEDLPQMEPGKIADLLPRLWASDLREHLGAASRKPQAPSSEDSKPKGKSQEPKAKSGDTNSSSVQNDGRGTINEERSVRRAVLFVDSYEMLGGTEDSRQEAVDSRQKADEWVRELVKQLPEALWVICGRQKLRWEEVDKDWGDSLSQHQLGALPDPAARKFLESCDIPTGQIQDAIIKGSQGVPHYLDLAVDAVQNAKGKLQNANLSRGSPEGLVAEFTQHLEKPELETLQVLSAARFWYYGLFEHLITQYQTGYPLTGYDDLARFSFVKDGAAPGTRTMHELMREALQEAQSPELRKRVHLFLHQLYAKELEGLDFKGITEKHRTALTEAFYHGRQAMSAARLWAWLNRTTNVFIGAGQLRLLTPLYQEIVQALETELGPNHEEAASARWEFARHLEFLSEYAEVEQLLRRALSIAEAGQEPESPYRLRLLDLLGLVLQRRGRFDEAEVLLRRVVEAFEKEPALSAAVRMNTLGHLAEVLTHMRKHEEAEGLWRRALAMSEKEFGPDHEKTAFALSGLLLLRFEQARYSEAEPGVRRVLAIYERKFGARDPRTMSALGNVAAALRNLHRYAEAEPLLRRNLKLREDILGPDHVQTALSANNLACLLRDTGRYAEAEPLARRALAAFQGKAGTDHPYTIRMTCNMVVVLAHLAKYDEAEQIALSLVADREKKRGPDHVETANALHAAGTVYLFQGRYADAGSYFRRALDIQTEALGPEHPGTLASLDCFARTAANQGNYAEAERLYRDVLTRQERANGPEHPMVAATANRLAGICARDGRYEEAGVLFRRALAIREKSFGPDHPFVAETLERLAKVCEQTGRTAEARDLSARAQRIRTPASSASS